MVNNLDSFDWSDAAVALLKDLWARGLSAGQIAGELGGVTRNAVIGKVHRLGLSGRARAGAMLKPKFVVPAPRSLKQSGTDAGVVRRIRSKAPRAVEEDEPEANELRDLPSDQSPDAVSFLERNFSTQCAWPLNAVVPIDAHQVCGAKRAGGDTSYCARHYRFSVQGTPSRAMSDGERHRRMLQARKNNQQTREQTRAFGGR